MNHGMSLRTLENSDDRAYNCQRVSAGSLPLQLGGVLTVVITVPAPHRAATIHLQSQHQLYTTSDNNTTAPQQRYRDTSPHSAMFSRLASTSTTASATATAAVVCPPALEIMSTSSIKYLRLTLTGYNLHQLGVLTHLCVPCIHAWRLLSISCHKISSKKLLITMGTGQQQWCVHQRWR